MSETLRRARRGQKHIDTRTWNNIIARLQKPISFDPKYFRDINSPQSRTISLYPAAEFPWHLLAFWWKRLAANKITVYAGTIRVDGVGLFQVAETDVTFTGSTEWVYVTISVTFSGGGTIAHSSTEPSSTTTVYRWPLYRFDAEGSVWSLASIRHFGDIIISVPTR